MNYRVPLIKASMPPIEEYNECLNQIWGSRRMSDNGDLHNLLQKKLSEYLSCPYVNLFSNGHMALECAIQTLPKKGEIITTPFTFASTTQAIVHSGFEPVFCDIDPHRLTIDANKIEELITDNTVAIVGVHVYGIPCDVQKIMEIAKKHNLVVIYDAAHSFGTQYNGRSITDYGDMTMFSFHSTKVFNTVEGGAVCCTDAKNYETLSKLKYFGFKNREDADFIGTNAKMSEFHAAMGVCNLNHLDEYIEKRRYYSEMYDDNFKSCEGISTVQYPKMLRRNYAYYPIIIDSNCVHTRDEIFDEMDRRGIQLRKYFYPLTNKYSCYGGKYLKYDLPVAEDVCSRILCLPLHSELTREEVQFVCESINEYTHML